MQNRILNFAALNLSVTIWSAFAILTLPVKTVKTCKTVAVSVAYPQPYPGEVLPSNRLMGMCRCLGSHFHDWIDYNGIAFSIDLLEWGRIFSGFGG